MQKKNIVLAVGHPFDLAVFCRLVPILRRELCISVTLLLARTHYFRMFDEYLKVAKSVADEVLVVETHHVPRYGLSALKHLINAGNLVKLIKELKKKTDCTLLIIDKSSLFSNVLLSHFSKAVLIQTQETVDLKRHYRLSLRRTILVNTYSILLNLHKFLIFKNRDAGKLVYFVQPIKLFQKVFYLSDQPGIRHLILPQVATRSSITTKQAIIFGSRYKNWGLLEGKRIEKTVFDIYHEISKCLVGYTVYYKPHPLEDGAEFQDVNNAFGGKLTNVGITLNSELFLTRNPDIEFCFSLGSTSSRSAYEMGFSSKVFYKCISLPQSLAATFDDLFVGMPKEFHIKNIADEAPAQCRKEIVEDVRELLMELK